MDNDNFISFNDESEPKAPNPQQFESPAASSGTSNQNQNANGGETQGASNGAGPNGQGQNQGRGGRRRRRRGRRHGRGGPAQNGQGALPGNQQNNQPRRDRQYQQHSGQQHGHGGRRHRHRGRDRQSGGAAHGGVFTAPMDHNYRQGPGNEVNGNTIDGGRSFSGGGNQRRFGRGQFRGGFQQNRGAGMPPAAFGGQVDPVVANGDAGTRIFAFIEDLFFVTKINETARKLNVKVEFVKTVEELLEKAGEEKPALIIVDLNNANAKPLTIIPKLKSQFKKGTSILGFVSHVQGDLKLKAQEAGCDSVLPRSAFSAHLPQLLRRHGAPEEIEES